jgi:uncharacterized protein YgiM (DUF1202 family)
MSELKRKVRVKLEYQAEYANPIQVTDGEKVSVGHEDDEYPGWKWCRASDGREGWIPVELLSQEGGEAIVLDDYSAQELSVRVGEEVEVEETRHKWLRVRNSQGKLGWIPASHVYPEIAI